MMKTWKWQLVVALVVVFLAGVATGLFAGARHAHFRFIMHHSEKTGDRMRRHLERQLHLTPDQTGQVGPIIDRAAEQLEVIRKETSTRVARTMGQAHDEMVPFLTPEQRQRLEEMKHKHQQMMRSHEPPPDGP